MKDITIKNLYTLDDRVSVVMAILFGLLHILAMFVSNLALITIIGAASGLEREITEKEITGALSCDGFGSALSALFGCPLVTSFSQNVGLVVNRFTIVALSLAVVFIVSILLSLLLPEDMDVKKL